MKNIGQIMRALQRRGFKIVFCDGSLVKIYPSDPDKPFYSLHIGERAIHPLKRFAKKNWDLDIANL